MRAVVSTNYGSTPVLATVETPAPGPDDVRVKVHTSSLNGFDIALAGGYLKDLMEHRFPVVLGRDFAGTVDEVGENVTAFAPGDDVFGMVLTQPLSAGGFAEYVVVPQDHHIARMPAGLDHATAGVLPLAGASAMTALDAARVGAGDTVLVSGATGGVGAFALQMAAARGATAVATARPGAATEHVRSLGAAHAVDHTGDLAAQVRGIAPDGVDVVLHFAGDPFVLADLLAPGGRFVSLLSVGQEQLADRDVTATAVYASPGREQLEELGRSAAAGSLRIPVQRRYPLAEAPRAFPDFAAGKLGKLAVTID